MPRTPIESACASSLGTILTGFVGILRERAAQGHLAPADLDHALNAFLRGENLDAAARLCAHAIEETTAEHVKGDAFGRLLVLPFAKLLDHGFPRTRLRSFFEAVRTIVGTDAMEQAEAACGDAAARLLLERGHKFAWDDLYVDPTARAAADRVLALIAKSFSPNWQKRLDWFATILNHDIHAISTGSHAFVVVDGGEPQQPVSPQMAEEILRLLLTDLDPRRMPAWRAEALEAACGGTGAAKITELAEILDARAGISDLPHRPKRA